MMLDGHTLQHVMQIGSHVPYLAWRVHTVKRMNQMGWLNVSQPLDHKRGKTWPSANDAATTVQQVIESDAAPVLPHIH